MKKGRGHNRKFVFSLVTLLLLASLFVTHHFYHDFPLFSAALEETKKEAEVESPNSEVGYYRVPVLLFHNLDGSGKYSISRHRFRAYLEEIRKNRIQVVSLKELEEHAKNGELFLKPTMVITIDDDYENIARVAVPMLREYRFPATIFVYTKDINTHPVGGMSWEDLQRLKREGFDIQNHSHSHSKFDEPRSGETEEHYEKRLDKEFYYSKNRLEEKLGEHSIYAFAYPMGYYNGRLIQWARDSGHRLLLTTDAKPVDLTEPFTGIFHRYTIEEWSEEESNRRFAGQISIARTGLPDKSIAVMEHVHN